MRDITLIINFIGSGNVATWLAQNLSQKGHQVLAVHSRDLNHANKLADLVNAVAVKDISDLPQSDLILIAVNDDAIEGVASELKQRKELIVHTSGAVDMNVMEGCHRRGVFYPFQTIRKNDFSTGFPILIEAENQADYRILHQLASDLTQEVCEMSSEQRQYLHLAAVFANNFSNYLHVLANRICKEKGVNPALLVPLVNKTGRDFLNAENSQTGPAVRRDVATLDRHIHLLENSPEIADIYRQLTKAIQNEKHE